MQPVADLLGRKLHQVLVDDVADMLEIGGERDDVDGAPAVLVVELAARETREVELDRLVQLVDVVVRRLDLAAQLVVVLLEDPQGLAPASAR